MGLKKQEKLLNSLNGNTYRYSQPSEDIVSDIFFYEKKPPDLKTTSYCLLNKKLRNSLCLLLQTKLLKN